MFLISEEFKNTKLLKENNVEILFDNVDDLDMPNKIRNMKRSILEKFNVEIITH